MFKHLDREDRKLIVWTMTFTAGGLALILLDATVGLTNIATLLSAGIY